MKLGLDRPKAREPADEPLEGDARLHSGGRLP
jgi:hypothetical protein